MAKEKRIIRPIQPTDNQGIYKLIQGILESYDLNKPGTAYFDPYLDHLYEFYQEQPNGEYWVIVEDEIVFGGIGVAPFGSHHEVAELQKFYISNDIQGQGYGRKLFEIAEEFAKEKSFVKLYVETMDTLETANAIYSHFGFTNRDAPISGSEHGLMNVWLEKEL